MLSVREHSEDKKFIYTNTKLIVRIETPLMTKPMYSKGEWSLESFMISSKKY